MNVRETKTVAADEAARWAIRIDAGSVNADTDQELQSWLGEDPHRRGALLRAEAALSFIDRGRALAGVVPIPESRSFWIRRKFMIAGAALAAGLAAVIVMLPGVTHYSTEVGQMLQVPLTDGSIVTLNTQSAIEVRMNGGLREVTLIRGEAWFHIAHDALRPFVVSAGHERVRAVGTAFDVRREDHGADVLVAEGIIDAWTAGKEDQRLRIAAGSKAYVDDQEPPKLISAPMDVERLLAWREGRIVLEGETLEEAAAQFNRYNVKRIVITDRGLADETLVGQFRATEPMMFASAVATTLGANVEQDGDTIRLSPAQRH
jgi:transmembrane sensor